MGANQSYASRFTDPNLLKYNELKLKQALVGQVKKFKEGEDITSWMSHIQMLIKYFDLDEEQARMLIYTNIEDNGLKRSVLEIMKQHQNLDIEELICQLQIALGAKSRALIVAQCRNMKRHDDETPSSFSLRVQDVYNQRAMTDPRGDMIIETDYHQEEMIDTFTRGLRSAEYASEVFDKGAKTLTEANIIIANYIARKTREANCLMENTEDISLEDDMDRFMNPSKAKFFTNSISQNQGQNSGFNGNNFRSSCDRCGLNPSHRSTQGECPALNAQCNLCNNFGHYAKKCNVNTQASTRPISTPAQHGHSQKKARQSTNERRAINNLDCTENELGAVGGEEVDATREEMVAALKVVRAQKQRSKEAEKQSKYYTE